MSPQVTRRRDWVHPGTGDWEAPPRPSRWASAGVVGLPAMRCRRGPPSQRRGDEPLPLQIRRASAADELPALAVRCGAVCSYFERSFVRAASRWPVPHRGRNPHGGQTQQHGSRGSCSGGVTGKARRTWMGWRLVRGGASQRQAASVEAVHPTVHPTSRLSLLARRWYHRLHSPTAASPVPC